MTRRSSIWPTSSCTVGMVDAHHREAVERDVLDEGAEGVLDRVEGAEMVEMLGVDIGDDGDVGGQLQEGAVGFVGLDHHPVALAHAGIGAVGVDDAAIDDGRDRGRRRRAASRRARSSSSCRACRRWRRMLEAHQLGQHLGAAHDRQAPLARGHQLGIVALDRRRDTTRTSAVAEVLGRVADEGP